MECCGAGKAAGSRDTQGLTSQLAAAAAPQPAIRLHPGAADIYRRKVDDLVTALSDPAISTEAAGTLGSLIERVVLTPQDGAPDGVTADLHGDLATILTLAQASDANPQPAAAMALSQHRRAGVPNEKPPGTYVPGGQLSVVAGIGFEPMTFRL